MEFTVKDSDYINFFESYEPNDILRRNFEDLKTKFDEIMPPINFIDNVSLVETLKNNVRTIYKWLCYTINSGLYTTKYRVF